MDIQRIATKREAKVMKRARSISVRNVAAISNLNEILKSTKTILGMVTMKRIPVKSVAKRSMQSNT